VDLLMPGYVAQALTDFAHTIPTRKEHQPHPHNEPQYSTNLQLTDPPDMT
jgi:hypothetical protein